MITKLKLENWKSHWKSEMDFSTGTNVLVGIMGSGKTSVLDAISFALFGTFPDHKTRKIALDDVVMNKPKEREKSRVEVSFQLNGSVHTVKRVIEKGKGTVKTELREGNQLIETGPTRVTEMIEKMLKVDYNLFTRAVYSEQNGIDYFLRIPKGQRMKKIDELLKLEKFEKARSTATSIFNQLKNTIQSNEKLIKEMESKEEFNKIPELEREVKNIKKQVSTLEKNYEEISNKKKVYEDEIKKDLEKKEKYKKLENDKNSIEASISNLEEDMQKLSEKIGGKSKEEVKKEKKKTEKNIEDYKSYKKSLEEERNKIIKKRQRIDVEIEELRSKINKLNSLEGDCPVCENPLTKKHKKEVLSSWNKKLKKLYKEEESITTEKIDKRIDETEKNIEAERKNKESLNELLKFFSDYMDKKGRLDGFQKRLGKIKRDISDLNWDEDKLESYRKKYQEASSKESELKSEIKNKKEMFSYKTKDLENLKKKKEEYETYKETLEKDKKIKEEMDKFKDILIDTQHSLRREFVKNVNYTLSDLWPYLYPYRDFEDLRLSVREGDYILEAKERDGKWKNIEGVASGGERTIAALALRMAFAFVLAPSLKWLILDEPTHNLDSKAIDDLTKVLRDKIGEFVEQVFIITHEERMEDAVTGYLYKLQREKSRNEPTDLNLLSSPGEN